MLVVSGVSPILYHITSSINAASILKNNRFELTTSYGAAAEQNLGSEAYYMSTSRTLSGHYIRNNAREGYTIFVIDGVKIAQRLRGNAVDYWGDLDPNKNRFESEDRIFSKDPFINNATKFIRSVHVCLDPDPSARGESALFYIRLYAKRAGIPAFFYNDRKYFAALSTKHAVAAPLARPRSAPVRDSKDYLKPWLSLYTMPKTEDSSKWPNNMKRYYAMLWYPSDYSALTSDVFNARSDKYGTGGGRESLDKFVSILKTNNWTIKDFWNFLVNKWTKRNVVNAESRC